MKDKREINISKHALMRYASRVHNFQIVSDRSFEIWKNLNENKIPDLEISLKEEFLNADYITTAAYEKHKNTEFYINKDLMMTYLVNENNMITCYQIDFGLDDTGNRQLLNVLLDNLQRATVGLDNFEEKHFEKREKINQELAVVKAEMELLNAKLKVLKETEGKLRSQSGEKSEKAAELLEVKKVAAEKIVRSKLAV